MSVRFDHLIVGRRLSSAREEIQESAISQSRRKLGRCQRRRASELCEQGRRADTEVNFVSLLLSHLRALLFLPLSGPVLPVLLLTSGPMFSIRAAVWCPFPLNLIVCSRCHYSGHTVMPATSVNLVQMLLSLQAFSANEYACDLLERALPWPASPSPS